MKSKVVIILSLLLLSTSLIFCQAKNEKETRIKFNELPNNIRNITKVLPKETKRLKAYKEIDGLKKSFEIKLKYRNNRYSIEFSENGIIEDIEIITTFNTLNKDVQILIEHYFKETYSKYKFIKIQKQYVFENNIEASTFVRDILIKKYNPSSNFEIIAEVKKEKKRTIREFTFNSKGLLINSRIVNPSSYEYVLY
ncbi:MAG: hypothetical protein EVB11_04580 [Winogradskyella sp.]|nr:MAG: hypothetical protein EVB11_04580 [Winogradskyella sp.]